MLRPTILLVALSSLGALAACSGAPDSAGSGGSSGSASSSASSASSSSHPRPPASAWPLAKLSEYEFFTGPLVDQAPADGVVPYDVIAPLWSDYAVKDRFLVVPKDGHVTMTAADDWSFPTNTVVIKTFRIPFDRRHPDQGSRPVETRLMVKTESGWKPFVYVYDSSGKDASLTVAGATLHVDTIDESGKAVNQRYFVPDTNMCRECHERKDGVHLLGVITLQLNHPIDGGSGTQSQLRYLAEQGVLAAAPEGLPSYPDPYDSKSASIEARARAYLAANCSHCHRPDGASGVSGVDLLVTQTDPHLYGVCKTPAAYTDPSGLVFDIVPGDPSRSILRARMDFLASAGSFGHDQVIQTQMPQIPITIPDPRGVALIEDWIAGLMPQGCP